MEAVTLGKNLHRESLLILLDLPACLWHNEPCFLFRAIWPSWGIKGTILQWFRSLANRSQLVIIGDTCLTSWPLGYGVPYCLILYPMLFNVYRKQLGEFIGDFEVGCHHYTDDQVGCWGSGVPLEEIMIWMRANNPGKTEINLAQKPMTWVSFCSEWGHTPSERASPQVLDSELHLDAQMLSYVERSFCPAFAGVPPAAIPEPAGICYSGSCHGDIKIRLLQYILCGAALEDNSEAVERAECSGPASC